MAHFNRFFFFFFGFAQKKKSGILTCEDFTYFFVISINMDDVFVSRGSVIRVCLYAVIFLLFLELSLNFSVHRKTYKMVSSSRRILTTLEDVSRFSLIVNFSDPCGWMQNATIRDLQKIRDRGCKPVRVCSSSPSELGM